MTPEEKAAIRARLQPGFYADTELRTRSAIGALLDALDERDRQHQEDDAALRRDYAAAIRALRAVEWTQDIDDMRCAWCWNYRDESHKDDCERQAVLATPSAQNVPAEDA